MNLLLTSHADILTDKSFPVADHVDVSEWNSDTVSEFEYDISEKKTGTRLILLSIMLFSWVFILKENRL